MGSTQAGEGGYCKGIDVHGSALWSATIRNNSRSSPNSEKKEMGLLSSLLKWNEVDPPSREEMLRNERVCKFYQHNRNPFVDHPEYAKLIYMEPPSFNTTP